MKYFQNMHLIRRLTSLMLIPVLQVPIEVVAGKKGFQDGPCNTIWVFTIHLTRAGRNIYIYNCM